MRELFWNDFSVSMDRAADLSLKADRRQTSPGTLERILAELGAIQIYVLDEKPFLIEWSDSRLKTNYVGFDNFLGGPYPLHVIFASEEVRRKFGRIIRKSDSLLRLDTPIEVRCNVNDALFIYRVKLIGQPHAEALSVEPKEAYVKDLRLLDGTMDRDVSSQLNTLPEQCLPEGDFYVLSHSAIYRFARQKAGYQNPMVFPKNKINDIPAYLGVLSDACSRAKKTINILFVDEQSKINFQKLIGERGMGISPGNAYQTSNGPLIVYSLRPS